MSTLILPHIISHRGCAGYAPENTLEAIHTAADMGARWVELDVKLTKDGEAILFHDDTLERTTNGNGAVADYTLTELRDLDAGYHFADTFSGVAIPTLEEALDVVLGRGLGLNLEIKPCPGREQDTAEATLDVLSHCWDTVDNLLVSSFSTVCLDTALDMVPDWKRGFLLPQEWPESWAEVARHVQASAVNVNGNTLTEAQAQDALTLDLPVLAYTINDPERAHLLQTWGIRTFFTDVPDVIEESILPIH